MSTVVHLLSTHSNSSPQVRDKENLSGRKTQLWPALSVCLCVCLDIWAQTGHSLCQAAAIRMRIRIRHVGALIIL